MEFCHFGCPNNREIAIIFWAVIFLFFVLSKKDVRLLILNVLKAFLNWKLLVPIILSLSYVALVVWLLRKWYIWDLFLTKDTIIWILGTASILFFSLNRVERDSNFFKKIVIKNVGLTAILEFIINTYTFNLPTELILVPLTFFVGAMSAVAETDEKYSLVKKASNAMLFLVGVAFITVAINGALSDVDNFLTINNLNKFILMPVLTLAFIPALYVLALVMVYETLFLRIETLLKGDKELIRYAKWRILFSYLCNLKKLNSFSINGAASLLNAKNKEDIDITLARV